MASPILVFRRFAGMVLLASCGLHAQTQMQGSGPAGMVRIFNTDLAVLEAQEPRKDLPCTVSPIKPFLGFDMRFHAGYEVSIPLRELAGAEDLLTTLFRVTPENKKDDVVYLSQKNTVPAIERDARGDAYLQGGFDLGEGRYHVDWLMRDRSERVCSFYWDSEAQLPAKDKQLALVIQPDTVQAAEREPFREEPPIERTGAEEPLNVKVLINFAPQNSRSATLQPLDLNALVAILRSVAREPRISRFSIVAFNMQEQRVLYRQEAAEHIDFPALGDALQSLKLGTVDIKRLSQKHGDTQFLTDLITQEMGSSDRPDALIFAGPKVMLDAAVPQETLKEVGGLEYPVFYMNYNFNPQSNPWRDAIGNTVKFFKGQEYTISRPRDLWSAWTDIVSRIVRLKIGRRDKGSASQ
ncbi:MAG: acetyltransferase [Acidobacteria bacterium]|nr:acetyltransferase [Acidobacteriota bacterium]